MKKLLAAVLFVPALAFCQIQENAPVGEAEDGAQAAPAPARRAGLYAPTALERSRQEAPPLLLAREGKATLPVILPRKATPATRAAAIELTNFLQRISGASFEVRTPDGKPFDPVLYPVKTLAAREQARLAEEARLAAPRESLPGSGIVVGSLEEWLAPGLEEPLAIRDIFHGREAFAIRTQSQRLLLIAATDRGVGHAVYRLLDELGCRWFFPNAHWEIIPAQSNLVFAADITDRPTIPARSIFFSDGGFSDEGVPRGQSREPRDLRNWQRRNLLGGSLQVSAGHMWQNVVKANLPVLREHPEYFAEVGGKRTGFQADAGGKPVLDAAGKPVVNIFAKLELGNPAVRRMMVDYVLAQFRAHPELDMVSMDPSDGGGHSESAESKKLGTVSDAVFGMANEAARAVQAQFPGRMVGLLAYNFHIAPPSFPLEPNVYVELTAGFNMSRYSYAELYGMWPKKARNLGFYEYFSVYDWDQDLLPGGRIASLAWLRDRIAFYAGLNAASLSAQSGNNWGPHGRGYYLASRLMWNPEAAVEPLLADFYEKAYGPAAPAMKRFHERICPDSSNLLSTAFMGQAFHDVEEASGAARGRPDVQARLGDIKQYLRYLDLRRRLDGEGDKAVKRERFVALMRQLYASRYSYMTHWAGAAYRLGKIYGVELNDITLVPAGGRGHPKFGKLAGDRKAPDVWVGTPELTPEQVEADFQDGLKQYPPVDVKELAFDYSDLVPVAFPPALPPVKAPVAGTPSGMRTDYYQGGPRYVFYSFRGEPLELDIVTGILAQYRGRGDATWTLSRMGRGIGTNAVVARGRMPLDNDSHHLTLAVPTNGAYALEFKSNGSGWTVTYPTNRPASVLWPRGGFSGFLGPVFYVPKGTREIQYYWDGYPHEIFGPDGKPAASIKGKGIVASVPVPAGMDGALWRMRTALRVVWFMNIPNCVAATPEALMIPRDLAEKDGLPIRR